MNVTIKKISPAQSALHSLTTAMGRFLEHLVSNSHAMRCSREAEYLFTLSDVELSRRGLTRDRIVHHPFARYLAS